MLTKSYSLPVALLRQFSFCPRIVFFSEVMGITPATPLWVKQGVDHHQRLTMLEKRRDLARYDLQDGERKFNVSLHSSALDIHGIADAVIVGADWVTVLEFKPFISQLSSAHWLQTAAYGLLAQAQFARRLKSLLILYGDKGKTAFSCNDLAALLEKTKKTIAAARAVVVGDYLPPSSAGEKQCGQCEYLNFCNDREFNHRYL